MADLNKSEESKDGSEGKGTPRELTDDELKLQLMVVNKDDLVAMILEGRRNKKDLEKQIADLSHAYFSAQQEVQILEEESEKVQHAHERELGLLFDESLSLRAEMDYDATALSLENARMKDELAAFVVMREQNEKLKHTVEKMHKALLAKSERHEQEMEDLRESVTKIKDKLHKEFRARIHKLSGEVSEAMAGGGDNSQAVNHAQNASKHQETESHIKVLMEKYTQLEAGYNKVKVEKGLLQQSMEFQTKQMLHRKSEMLESRERCASLTHDLRDAKYVIDEYKKEMKSVHALKDKIYEQTLQIRQLTDKVAAGTRDTMQWKTRAANLKKALRTEKTASNKDATKPAMGGGAANGWTAGVPRSERDVLPVVTRGVSSTTAWDDQGKRGKTAKGEDFGQVFSSDEDDWGDEGEWADADQRESGGQSSSPTRETSSMRGGMAAVSKSTMNFSKIYERSRQSSTVPMPEDNDINIQRIWSARFASEENDVQMGAGIVGVGDEIEKFRSVSAPPQQVDMTRSGSSLGIGNNAMLYLPPGPKGLDGRKTDPVKMFAVSIPGKQKKPKNSRFLNFI